MSFTDLALDFVTKKGTARKRVRVPESCIDSAEHIIQTLNPPAPRKTRKVGKSKKTARAVPVPQRDMIAEFGNWSFNASKALNFQNDPMVQTATDFDFQGSLPEVGEGIVLLNKSSADLTSNMHFGAIVARSSHKAVISDVSQVQDNYGDVPLEVTVIKSPEHFRQMTFGKLAKHYVIGRLKAKGK